MVQRVEQSGQLSGRSKKVPQSSAKAVKTTVKKAKSTDTTRRAPDAVSSEGAIRVVANLAARLSADERRSLIAEAAYLRAERRGFANGDEVDDWLAAEAEIDARYPK